jgi:uncharacterized membrane protein
MVAMKSKYKIIIFLFSFILVLALVGYSLASVEGGTQKTLRSVQVTGFSVSPFKGPFAAPVEIAVFSDFQ